MSLDLEARDVRHRFANLSALDGVTLRVVAGAVVALVGESGSGKTTLLRCFNRMIELTPGGGDVFVAGVGVRQQDVIQLRRQLGYVPQNGGLLPHWTVVQNVGLVLRARGATGANAVTRALDLVGLDAGAFGTRYPHELSGGQRQRVALARAVAAQPGALLMDEPFGALDAITRAEMYDAFARLRGELGVTTLLVTHDLAEAARLADQIVVLRAGRVEQRGSFAELRDSPASDYVKTLVERALAAAEKLIA